MVWEFKQFLFVTQRRVSQKLVADLSNPAIRSQLQAHIDSIGGLPQPGAPDEYAALFEAAYAAESDRRVYLDSKLSGAKPSHGHIALATLMQGQLCRIIWTTNFDPLVADACAKVYDSTGRLTTVALDAPELATQCLTEGRWPLEIKLHGDFRSRRLKNTKDELRLQDRQLRQLLIDACQRSGLVVAGYSGRDESIMEALEAAVREGAFPAGLFWLHRGDDPPLSRVQDLLLKASQAGIDAALIRIESFDEVMGDLVRLKPDIDMRALNAFALQRPRVTAAPAPAGNRSWPVIRLNGLPVVHMPTVCRRIICSIGGHAEVQQAIEDAGVNVLATRTQERGVLGFGSDADMRSAFGKYTITDFDLQSIETKRLRYDSGERGLLRSALTRALTGILGLTAFRHGSSDLLIPSDSDDNIWAELKKQVAPLAGVLPNHPELRWHEGIGVRLDWASDTLWLLIEPRTVFVGISDENRGAAADFARERSVKRYNRQLNALIALWAEYLPAGGEDLRAFGISDGVDAVFRLSNTTAFSKRAGA